MNDAIGIIEMFGFVTAITAADAAAKLQTLKLLQSTQISRQTPIR